MTTLATPEGSPSLRQAEAWAAPAVSAAAAAARSNGPAGSPDGGGACGSSLIVGPAGSGLLAGVGTAAIGFSTAAGVATSAGLSWGVATRAGAGLVGVVSNVTSSAAVGSGAATLAS